MRREPFLYPDKETFPDKKRWVIISSEESSFIPKRSLQNQLEGSPSSTRGIAKCLVRKNHKDYLNTPFGTILSNSSPEPLHPSLADSFPSPRATSPRHRNLYPNT